MKQNIVVFWFRRDLRLEDNHGLMNALKSGFPVLPVFIFDKNILNSLSSREDARVTFIYETLSKMNETLKKLNSSLYVLHGNPREVFEKICGEFNVMSVFTNNDYEPYAIKRDTEISQFLKSKNISFHSYKDQVIFEKSEILKDDNTPYLIFTPYSKVWKSNYVNRRGEKFQSENYLENLIKAQPFSFPTLMDIGFKESAIIPPPINIDEKIITNYHTTRNIPSIEGTSNLSVHLRFGTLSIRKLAALAYVLNGEWLNELIWREFFMMILFHFPHVITKSFKSKYDNIKWLNNEKEFDSWCKGETGYPIVDAGMRQLNQSGLMHNRVRMIVASFLTKHLLIDWRWGEAYFAEKLLDFELSSNNGNWQWAAGCGCDAAPYFRIFNPAEQMKRFDPDLVYVKRWLGDLNNYTVPPIIEHTYARKRALEAFKKI